MTISPERRQIALFGNFGTGNLGNEATLDAMLHTLRRLVPDAEFTCICPGPDTVSAAYHVSAVSSDDSTVKRWVHRNPLAKWARRFLVGMPKELCRWRTCIRALWDTDALIVPGTGLLTDAYGLFNWGPYGVFRWSAAAKLCRCKLFFVSVGAGPLYTRIGKFCVKAALNLADFRSYRDESSRRYLKGISFQTDDDPVYPDLAFSLPHDLIRSGCDASSQRLVVGIGLMEYAGKYSVERRTTTVHRAYLQTLAEFAEWLLAHEYDVRLLIGDAGDTVVTREFRALLKERSVTFEDDRIINENVASFQDVLSQIAATDFVVGTRFHNILFSILLNKPTIAISFHHKCASLMGQMELGDYCVDINSLRVDRLIEQFGQLEKNAESLKALMVERVKSCRNALDEQYCAIFSHISPGEQHLAAYAKPVQRKPHSVDL